MQTMSVQEAPTEHGMRTLKVTGPLGTTTYCQDQLGPWFRLYGPAQMGALHAISEHLA